MRVMVRCRRGLPMVTGPKRDPRRTTAAPQILELWRWAHAVCKMFVPAPKKRHPPYLATTSQHRTSRYPDIAREPRVVHDSLLLTVRDFLRLAVRDSLPMARVLCSGELIDRQRRRQHDEQHGSEEPDASELCP